MFLKFVQVNGPTRFMSKKLNLGLIHGINRVSPNPDIVANELGHTGSYGSGLNWTLN